MNTKRFFRFDLFCFFLFFSFSQRGVGESTIFIASAKVDDSGNYTCQAENGVTNADGDPIVATMSVPVVITG